MKKNQQGGFTLLEVLLAIGVSLSIGAVALTELRRTNESKQAIAVGQQLASVGEAMNTYLALQYTNITSLNEVTGAGTAADPGPRRCYPNMGTLNGVPYSICTITTDTLVRSGLLPSSFSGRNAFGADYNLYIRVAGASPNFIVEGLAVTDRPYRTGGTTADDEGRNRYDLLGQAMQEAGADAGMTRTLANTLEGLNGTWADSDWPSLPVPAPETSEGVNRLGLLGYRSGYGSSGYAAYLRIDGTIPMTGNLDMDAHDIRNVRQVQTDTLRVAGDLMTLSAGPCEPNNGPCNNDDPNRTDFVGSSTTGALNINNRGGVSIRNIDGTSAGNFAANDGQFDGTINANGDIRAQGNIEANDLTARNNISAAGTIRANGTIQGGAITTSGNGNITAGGTGTVQGYNVVGTNQVSSGAYNISAAGLRNGTQPAWFYQTGADAAWRTTGNVSVDGQTRTGTLRVDTNAQVGGVLTLSGSSSTVTEGASCAAADYGALRRTGSADAPLVTCVNATWQRLAMGNTFVAVGPTVASPGTHTSATTTTTAPCPAGSKVVGGGHLLISFLPGGGGFDGNSPSRSYPSANGWTLELDQRTGSSTFQPRAVCAY